MNDRVYRIYREQVLGNKHQWTDKQLKKIESAYESIDENFYIGSLYLSEGDFTILPNFSWVTCDYFTCGLNSRLQSLVGCPRKAKEISINRTNIKLDECRHITNPTHGLTVGPDQEKGLYSFLLDKRKRKNLKRIDVFIFSENYSESPNFIKIKNDKVLAKEIEIVEQGRWYTIKINKYAHP
jgi:hypothetical protein